MEPGDEASHMIDGSTKIIRFFVNSYVKLQTSIALPSKSLNYFCKQKKTP